MRFFNPKREITTTLDKRSQLWTVECDCGWKVPNDTFEVMARYRRLHAAVHRRRGQEVLV